MMEELTIIGIEKSKYKQIPGPDEIGARLLVELSKSISHAIRKIFETSIKIASIPNDWKEWKVSAIYKKGNTSVASKYRPVSITSILCKCM